MIRRVTKIFLLLICLYFFPIFVNASTFNDSLSVAGNYMNNVIYKDTYSRYIFIPSNKGPFYNALNEDIIYLNYGGMISKKEVDITLNGRSDIGFSYLYNGNAFWTLSKSNTNNSRYVVDDKFSIDSNKSTSLDIINDDSKYVSTKVTEFVNTDTKIYGNGTYSDPWFFLPQYKLTLKVNNPSFGKIISGNDLVNSSDFVLTNSESADLYIKPMEGYLYLGNSCGNFVNDISAINEQKSNSKPESGFLLKIQGLNKDTECTISFGEKPLEINLDQTDTTTHSRPEKLYLKNKLSWYMEYSINTQVSKIPNIPLRKGYTFKGYYKDRTLGDTPNSNCNGSDKKYIDENGILTNDSSLLNELNDGTTLKTCFVPNEFTVEYDKNDSLATGTMNSHTCIYDKTCLVSENIFVKSGYTLKKWIASNGKEVKLNEDITNIIDGGTVVLKGQWEANAYLVSFDTNGGGTSPNKISVYYDSVYGDLPTINRSGYNFDGWYTSKDGGTKVTSSTKVTTTSSHTLYAKWSPMTYTITFDANGGTNLSTSSIAVKYSQTYGTLPTVSKSGFAFAGWYTSKDGGTKVTSDTILQNANNHTLYARWSANSYTVSFNGNGGSVNTSSKDVIYGKTYDSLPNATRTGYTFTGWYMTSSGGTRVTSSTVVSTASNHTLYAGWSANEYTVTLDGNNATSTTHTESIKAKYDTAMPSITKPTRNYTVRYDVNGGSMSVSSASTSYTFNGYYLDNIQYYKSDGSSARTWNKASNATLTASWTSNSIILESASRVGYTFDGWYDSSSGGNKVGSAGDLFTPIRNITLYARWSPISYIIKFVPGTGGTGTMSNMTLKYTEEKNLSANTFTRIGYTFDGWSGSNGKTYADRASVYNLSTTNGSTITMTANWKSNNYSVNLDGNGATSIDHTKSITPKFDNAMPSITKPTRKYTVSFNSNGGSVNSSSLVSTYTFNGYYYDSIKYYSADGSSARNWDRAETTTLKASWSGGEITLPGATRNGYLLEGWYDSASGGTKVGTAGSSYIPKSNITLYPNWTPITYYIKFDAGSGSGTMSQMTMKYGEVKKLTANTFARTGYSFKNWSGSNGNTYNNNQEVSNLTTSNGATITLTTVWSANKYTATLNDNGATSTNHTESISVTYDSAMPSIVIPSRSLVVSYNANLGTVTPTSSTAVSSFKGYSLDSVLYYNSTGGSVRNWNKAGNATLVAQWTDSSVSLPLPTRNCYTFNGWYTAASGGTKVGTNGDSYTPNKNVTLYAGWKPNSYTVTLNPNGATSTNHTTSLTATCDSAMPSITKPSRSYTVSLDANTGNVSTAALTSNYTFSGYYYNSTQYYTSTGASAKYWGEASNATLSAKWSGGQVTLPAATKSGYIFSGWYTAKTGGTKVGNAGDSYLPIANVTLYARWSSSTYTISLNGNGATSTTHKTSVNSTFDAALPTIDKTQLPTRIYTVTYDTTGGSSVSNSSSKYTFKGYYKDNIQYYNADGTSARNWNIPENTTLSAKWDDGVVTLPVSSKDGYIFKGWYSAATGGSLIGIAGASYTPNKNVTLYAQWTPITYYIKFASAGGSGTMSSMTVNYGQTVTLNSNVYTKSGYKFAGWTGSDNKNYTDKQSVSNLTKNNGATITMTARWSANSYNLTLAPNNGVCSTTSITATYGNAMPNITPCTRSYTVTFNGNGGTTSSSSLKATYVFNGFDYNSVKYYKADGTSANVWNVASDATLTANWSSSTIILPTATRTGYSLKGWFTAASGGTKAGSSGTVYTPSTNTTLYAQWSPISYTIKFDSNGGSGTMANMSVPYASAVTLTANAFSKTGYTFTGWTGSDGKSYSNKQSVSNLSSNGGTITMKANWKANSYSATINANGGSCTQTSVDVTYGNALPSISCSARKYTVSFDGNGGTSGSASLTSAYTLDGFYYNSNQYYNGSGTSVRNWDIAGNASLTAQWSGGAITLPNATRTGYTFKGWYTSKTGGTKVGGSGSSYSPTAGVTLYAQWTAKTYSLTINGNGGSCTPSTVTATYGNAMPSISCAARNYTISFNANGGTVSSSSLTGKYTLNGLYYNSIQYYNSSAVSARTWNVDSSATITASWSGGTITLPTPTRSGYIFNGWYTAASGGTKAGNGGDTYTTKSNTTLYAQWSQIGYTVKFVTNCGSGTMSNMSFKYGEVKNLTANAFSCTGHYFNGWTASNGNSYADKAEVYNLSTTNGATITMTAKWAANKYTVTLNGNGATSTNHTKSVTATYNSAMPTISILPTREYKITFNGNGGTASSSSINAKYTFGGYSSGSTKYYIDTGASARTWNIASNSTLNAEWSGGVIKLPNASRTGYKFNGWYTAASGGTSKGGFDSSYTATGNTTLYARWSPINYTIKFAPNGGTGTMSNLAMIYGVTNNLTANTFTNNGYSFGGWSGSDGKSYSDGQSVSNLTSSDGGVVTMTAKWNANTYYVNYDANGGSGAPAQQSFKFNSGDKISTSKPIRTGYSFVKWVSNPNNVDFAPGATIPNGWGTFALVAQWKANTYTISYNANGGSGTMDSHTATYGNSIKIKDNTFTAPTGYTFAGWTTKSDGTDDGYGWSSSGLGWSGTWKYVNGQYGISDGKLVLYARWKANTYTITYNANGGSGTMDSHTATYGNSIKIKDNAFTPPAGHTFVGWTTNSNGTDDGHGWSSSGLGWSGTWKYVNGQYGISGGKLVLYARWKINTYTVSYNANGGSGAPSAQTKTYGVNLTLSSTKPTRTGYIFLGWSTSSSATSVNYAAGASYTGNANLTLYAVWQYASYTLTFDGNTNNLTGGYGYLLATFKKKTVSNVPAAVTGSTITLPNGPTATGNGGSFIKWTFVGWSTDATASGQNPTPTPYKPGETITLTKDTTLYALWYYTSTTTGANTWYNP